MVKLTKTQQILTGIAGAGILGTALYFFLRGKKAEITVQYGSEVDRDAAQTIAKGLKAKNIVGPLQLFDVRTITQPLVVVGGQMANPSGYGALVNMGVLPGITSEHSTIGLISVGYFRGVKVVGVAGWHKEGTDAAARYLAKLGKLPDKTLVVSITGTSNCSSLCAIPYSEWKEPVFIPGG